MSGRISEQELEPGLVLKIKEVEAKADKSYVESIKTEIESTLTQVTDTTINEIGKNKKGTGSFAGNGLEVTVPHGLSKIPVHVTITPSENPLGYLGEVWSRKDATNMYIGNSGSFQGAFTWIAYE